MFLMGIHFNVEFGVLRFLDLVYLENKDLVALVLLWMLWIIIFRVRE